MQSTVRWILISLALAAVGCSGTSVGNPPGAAVRLGAVGTIDTIAPPVTQKEAAGNLAGGVTIAEAWVVLRDIDLRESGRCSASDDDDEDSGSSDGENEGFDAPGAYAADLLTGTIYPEAPEWETLSDESYCALETGVGPASSAISGAPEALAEGGAYLRGARADGTPFEIRVPVDEELRLGPSGKNAFVLGQGPVGLLVTFNMNTWVNPALLDKAEVNGGSIYADPGENAELAESVKARLAQSARLMRDKDRDGKLGDEDGEL